MLHLLTIEAARGGIMGNNVKVLQDIQQEEENKKFYEFAERLEKAGVFPREYDLESLKTLYTAAEAVHRHLCRLDRGYYTKAREVKLFELANVYSDGKSGLRKLV